MRVFAAVFARLELWFLSGSSLCRARPQSHAEDEELPAIHTLAMRQQAARTRTGAVADFPSPLCRNFPVLLTCLFVGTFAEGYVVFHYTITAEGKVSDITVLELVGPQAFLDSSEKVLKNWTYKPATLNGKPVATARTLKIVSRSRGVRSAAGDCSALARPSKT